MFINIWDYKIIQGVPAVGDKRKLTFLGILTVIFFSILIVFNHMQINSKADLPSITDKEAIQKAPYGLALDKYFSHPATFPTGEKNYVYTYNPDTANNIVILTDNRNQTSAVWSDGDNYIDINKKQTLSMCLYFGANLTIGGPADGIAFVLQNDSRGVNAISTLNGKVNKGETLGVWGSDLSKYVTNDPTPLPTDNTTPIQLQAIQNSWALEFDTRTNSSKVDPGNSFDSLGYPGSNPTLPNPIIGSHIAWNYPARATSYEQISPNKPEYSWGFLSGKSVMGLNHNFGSNLSFNGNDLNFTSFGSSTEPAEKWKHVTITYNPPTSADSNTATIDYAFNDKSVYGTTIKPLPGNASFATIPVDLSEFGTVKDGKLRFGFTGSTGSGTNDNTTNAIVFETMPSIVEATLNSYAVDKDIHARVGSDTSLMDTDAQAMNETTKVHPGDNIGLNYMMRYDSGKQPSKDVTADVDIPDNLTVKNDDGNIGTIYYTGIDNATKKETTKEVAISQEDLSTDNKSASVKIENMGMTDDDAKYWKTARIEINTTANPITSGTSLNVPSAHASFEGPNYKSDTQIPSFDIVKPADTLVLKKTSGDGTYPSGKEVDLKGEIKYGTNTAVVDNKTVWYTYQIDNQAPVTTQDTGTSNGVFSIPIEKLDGGKHTIKVKASATLDSGEIISSNELEYDVNIQDFMITNKAQVYDESQSRFITDGDTVQEGDKLQYQYNVSYDEGVQDLNQITLTIPQPDNLSLRKMDGTNSVIGNYTNYQGDTKSYKQVADGSSPYTYTFKNPLGNNNSSSSADQYKSAKIVYYMTANDVDTDTVVNSTNVDVTDSTLYKGSMSTPSFTIRDAKYKPHLEATGGTDSQSVANTDDFTLTGLVTYFTNDDAHTKTDFNNSDMTVYTRVDGSALDDSGFEKVGTLSDSNKPGEMTILRNASSLSNGVHDIYVKVTDKYGNVSNTVDYEVIVGDKALSVTPDQKERTVEDSLPVKLTGTYKHTDGSALEGTSLTIRYVINSELVGKAQSTQTVTYTDGYQTGDTSRKFSFDVDPVGYNRDSSMTYDEWNDAIKSNSVAGLRVGKNTINVLLTDAGGHSVRTSYVVNVPDVDLNLSLTNNDLNMMSTSDTLNVPLSLKYDGNYKVNSLADTDKAMFLYANKPNNSEYARTPLDAINDSATDDPVTSKETTAGISKSDLEDSAGYSDDSQDSGVGSKQPIEFYAEDLYGRKSNVVSGTLTYISKSVTLTSNTNYKFDAVNKSAENRIVKRNGKWTLDVDSVKSAWKLSATAGPMTTEDAAKNIFTLPGNLIFVDKDNNSYSMQDKTPIASNNDNSSEDVNIAGSWGDNDGILLNLAGEPAPGQYETKINWTLSNTL